MPIDPKRLDGCMAGVLSSYRKVLRRTYSTYRGTRKYHPDDELNLFASTRMVRDQPKPHNAPHRGTHLEQFLSIRRLQELSRYHLDKNEFYATVEFSNIVPNE